VRALAASVVDWAALGKVVVAALVAGVGVTFCFSLAVAGATRFAEMRRADRTAGAVVYAAIGIAGLLVTVAAVVIGIVVMTKKS
jgi:hypothetical protein